MKNLVFIIGHGRTASTAIVEICNLASNAKFYSEKTPKLCMESRLQYEGKTEISLSDIKKLKNDLYLESIKHDIVIGDKNPNYLLFVEDLFQLFECKFIFLYKKPIDVIQSCINAANYNSNRGRGVFFGSAEDDQDSAITNKEDWWDYSRFRPKKDKDSEIYITWKQLSQIEKAAWSWNRFHEILIEKILLIPRNKRIVLDSNKLTVSKIRSVYKFCDIGGFDEKNVANHLNSKINSYVANAREIGNEFIASTEAKNLIQKHTKQTHEKFIDIILNER
tara:strand:+ start:5708 stop:6541 length:834 start_codon:yes stop_codon:yes gene_type:complete